MRWVETARVGNTSATFGFDGDVYFVETRVGDFDEYNEFETIDAAMKHYSDWIADVDLLEGD